MKFDPESLGIYLKKTMTNICKGELQESDHLNIKFFKAHISNQKTLIGTLQSN